MEIRTPRYMIREELERKQMSSRAAKRAYGFERRLDEERGGELARICLEEVRGNVERGKREFGVRKKVFLGKRSRD